MSLELNALQTRLEQLEHANAQIKTENAQMQAQFRTAQRRLRIQAMLAFCGLLAAIFLSPSNRAAIAQGYGVTLATLNTRLTAVEAKTQFQSADAIAKSTTFSACNVVVQNGLGATNGVPNNPYTTNPNVNGLGNLIIGYNQLRGNNQDARTGSHNLILGDANNYSSFGGIVAGYRNAISEQYASVFGGEFNTASGSLAAIVGGFSNTASGSQAAIVGGQYNTASSYYSAVLGGYSNTASRSSACVSGGEFNTATGFVASVSGGYANTASGDWASIIGGRENTASSHDFASISGGFQNTASGVFSSISGGRNLAVSAFCGWGAGSSANNAVSGNFSSP